MSSTLRLLAPLAASLVAALVACTSDDAGATGDEQNVTSGTCEVFSAITKKKLTSAELQNLKDPIAQKLLLGEGCPENFDEISEKLARTDAKGCENGAGLKTRLVNDSAFLTGRAEGAYRGVITRDCDGRGEHDLFMSVFGMTPEDDRLPQEQTELIGMDRTSGVFNFYVRESRENKWVFMGSSKDGISQGYDCNDAGACQPKAAREARCWACHEGGGINMKELNSPWDSWNPQTEMPGNKEIFAKHGKQLGKATSGADLEQRVKAGNAVWNKTRIETLKQLGAAEVVRPLFCTLTINLQSGGTEGNLAKIPGNFFVNDLFRGSSVAVDNADYQALLKQNGQQVTDGRAQLVGKNGPVIDTQNAFRYIEKGQVDLDYIDQLIALKIIDDDFVKDVAHVDFTRPNFSKTRCDLLAFAPKLSGADLTPDKIRDGFKANLQGKPGAAAQLLASLEDTKDASKHQSDVTAFFKACEARPKKDLLADALVVLSSARRQATAFKGRDGSARGQGIIEFPETLPVDKLPASNKAFNPATCTLE